MIVSGPGYTANWDAVSSICAVISAIAGAVAAVAAWRALSLAGKLPERERLERRREIMRSRFEDTILRPVHDSLRDFIDASLAELEPTCDSTSGFLESDPRRSELQTQMKDIISKFNSHFLRMKGAIVSRVEAFEGKDLALTVAEELNAMQDRFTASIEKWGAEGPRPDLKGLVEAANVRTIVALRRYQDEKWAIN